MPSKHSRKFAWILAASGLIGGANANAVESLGTLNMGFGFGGDEIITFVFDNGDETTIKGGAGLSFDIGTILTFDEMPIEAQASIGYKFHRTSASNGSASFSRIPIEALGFYRKGPHRLGGGLAYHLNPTFSCDITGVCNGDLDFDNGVGFIAEYNFLGDMNNEMSYALGLRYTKIEYAIAGAPPLDGSGVALVMRLWGPWVAKPKK